MLKRNSQLPKGKLGNNNNNDNEKIKVSFMQKKYRSMRGVRKEINYSEPCSYAPEAEFGLYPFDHSLTALARAQMGTTQTQLCFIWGI